MSKNTRRANHAQLRRIYIRDNAICFRCRCSVAWEDASRGHIISVLRNGGNSDDNIVLEHKDCNHSAHDVPPNVKPVDYAMDIWHELFDGKEMHLNRLKWALDIISELGTFDASVAAKNALRYLKTIDKGNFVRLCKTVDCNGLVFRVVKAGDFGPCSEGCSE